ncbi:hypothetical protein [Marinibactrum halimedae]|uniref:Flagellar hook-length control protein FliK n=1 Tax=Marinibactrum halimedae TaxID=1444977 RepID=A0AA37WPZ0_9GAMM|nr:hypothetical protein [Marinibactrum halimedae]MCD9460400.1 hypothetical protein [Marinibactrum halimedae]GLS27471.1 hypothetical protein GCM10007877_31900 [Marinibactrum halimedae]
MSIPTDLQRVIQTLPPDRKAPQRSEGLGASVGQTDTGASSARSSTTSHERIGSPSSATLPRAPTVATVLSSVPLSQLTLPAGAEEVAAFKGATLAVLLALPSSQNPLMASVPSASQQWALTNQTLNVGAQVVVAANADGHLRLLPIKAATVSILQHALQQSFPKQGSISDVFSLLSHLLKPENASLMKSLPANTPSLATQLFQQPSLQSSQGVRSALLNSGVFAERQLLSTILSRQLSSQHSSTQGEGNRSVGGEKPLHLADMKWQLSQLSQGLSAGLPAAKAGGVEPTMQLPSNPSAWLMLLLGRLKHSGSQSRDGARAIQELQTTLKNAVDQALAKIQLNQQLGLSEHLIPHEQRLSPHIPIELPLPWGNETQTLRVRWYGEEDATPERRAKTGKHKQWRLMLDFNLDEQGTLYAEVIAVEEHISTKFWSEKPPLLDKVRQCAEGLKQGLWSEGVVVDHIAYLSGKPPDTDMGLGYSIIDVKT